MGRCEVGWCTTCLVERHVEVDAQGVIDQLVHYEGRFGPDGQVVLELEDEEHQQQEGACGRDDDTGR